MLFARRITRIIRNRYGKLTTIDERDHLRTQHNITITLVTAFDAFQQRAKQTVITFFKRIEWKQFLVYKMDKVYQTLLYV